MTRLRVLSHEVAWLPWSPEAFARARSERKAVLLFISTGWCHWCRQMDLTSYADPEIATTINGRFIPVRVDADQRPDISERYNLGGWPTTAFLTPDGEVLTGGTYVPIERMPGVLAQVAAAFGARDDGFAVSTGVAAQAAASGAEPLAHDDWPDLIFSTFDAEHGGFGSEPKFPLVAPIQLALDLSAGPAGDRYEQIAVTTLDAMGWGGLYDEVDGGFFRYAATGDWRLPQSEKMLDANAALLGVYLEAGARLGIARFTERAADTLRYLQTWLADPVDGGWAGSQQADADYYAAAPDKRRTMTPPPVSRLLYADWNAAMVSAALHAARVFSDDGLRDFALKSLERVLLACYRPGAGVAHYFDGEARVRGLLADQVAMASACLDAFEVTGNVVYEMMAEELGHFAVRTLWDAEGGGFFDRGHDADSQVGLLRVPLKPFALNCDAVRMLRRLAATSGEHEFTRIADATLAAMAPVAATQGPLAAHYVLALNSGDKLREPQNPEP